MRKRILIFIMFLLFLFSFSGCYYFSARNEIRTAEKLLLDLKGAGGESKTPYEYCSAESFLYGAKLEFEHNDFKVAKDLATRSKTASEAGLAEVKKK